MGGYLGDFVNNLRSALNYAFKDYCEQRKFPKKKDGKRISTDFPYGLTKDEFDSKKVISLVSKFDPNLYKYLEEIQPYHPKQGLLGNIMKISNMDKHEVLVTVQNFDIDSFFFTGLTVFKPIHLGDKVLVGYSDGKPDFFATPFYHSVFRMYALPNGKWLNFMIPINDHFLEFIPFIRNTGGSVVKILNKFQRSWK